MKTTGARHTNIVASALLTTLVICSILSIFVLYYLSLIDQQSFLSARSQSWNMAIVISEAGIEEGMAHLNINYPSLATDNWAYNSADGTYTRTNTVDANGSYTVTIYVTNSLNPVVISRAYVYMPAKYGNAARSSFFAAIGAQPSQTQGPVTRAIQVTCAKGNLFTAALVVKNTIDLHGNGIYTDSYDSSDPAKSTNGQYDSSKYSGNYGDIATDGGITSSVSIQNGNIYGTVHTGPGCPVTIGSQGGVGPHGAQVNDVATATERGYIVQDASFTFPDTTLPNTSSWLTPTGGVVITTSYVQTTNLVSTSTYTNTPGLTTNTTAYQSMSAPPSPGTYLGPVTTNVTTHGHNSTYTYNYNLISGGYSYPTYATNACNSTNTYAHILWGNNTTTNYYVANSLSGSNLITGPNVVLALPNGLTGAENWIFDTGASLKIYSGGTSVAAAGNTIINPNGNAGSFVVLCAPAVTSFSLSGNGQFTGCLVAPNANVSLNGGGNNNQDFCGCLMANSITMNGHFSFHWDEALRNAASQGRFLITSWSEIP